jgi:hypothetical protein
MATDYETLVYDRIWELLAAHTPLTSSASATYIRAGNKINWNTGRPKPNKSEADFISAEVDVRLGDFADSLFAEAKRYAFTHTFDPTSAGWAQVLDFGFDIIVTHRTTDVSTNNALETEVRVAIAKGGPRLGQQWINSAGPLTGTREHGITDTSGGSTTRTRTVFRLPVRVVIDGRLQLV